MTMFPPGGARTGPVLDVDGRCCGSRYTQDLLPALRVAAVPTRLIWRREDDFQKISFARRYVSEVPGSDLVDVAGKHIPMEDSPRDIAAAMLGHLTGH